MKHRAFRTFLVAAAALMAWAAPARAADLIGFWDTQQRGANCFNGRPPEQGYFEALRAMGGTWVRLTFYKWQGEGRDFLIGNADNYQGLVQSDLAILRATLDHAHAADIKVVLTPATLPGARNQQYNDDVFDDRLWSDRAYWEQSAAFWRDLAAAVKDHPAIAAYNVLNEPAPERRGGLDEHIDSETSARWYAQQRGGARDLRAFYRQVVAAIREVDAATPIMLDAGFYAAADALEHFGAPLEDERILYAFHMYEPWSATSAPNMRREAPYSYPGAAPFGGGMAQWDAARVAAYLQRPVDWANANGVARNRLVAGEFGCMRRWADCPRYLEDVLSVINDRFDLHWAFYSFREDVWDGMNYELGTGPAGAYWAASEAGRPYAYPDIGENPVFAPILRRLAGP